MSGLIEKVSRFSATTTPILLVSSYSPHLELSHNSNVDAESKVANEAAYYVIEHLPKSVDF